MPVYTLYLSTQITSPTTSLIVPVDKTNLASVLWRVDFNSLFRDELDNYKYCRVRYNLIGETFTASTPASSDWTNYNGYLSVTLPSTFNGTTTNGTILGLTNVQDSPVTGTGIHCVFNSTMSDCGVDINAQSLKNVMEMRVSLMGWLTGQPIATMQEYQILLSFELYN